jgi:hypothetical protein
MRTMTRALTRLTQVFESGDFVAVLVFAIAGFDLSLWLLAKGIVLASSHELANIPLIFEAQNYP